MRVLLDNNVNQKLATVISGHYISHAREMGWAELENGDLISAAESAGFDAIITADKGMRHQQTIVGRKICILVLNTLFVKWPYIQALAPQIQKTLDGNLPVGQFMVIEPQKGG